jgi:hypothetical protein
MVNKTIGSGGDYATWNDVWVALIALSPISDNYTFTQISDITDTIWTWGQVNFNGYTVTFTSNKDHGGNPNNAWVSYLTADTQMQVIDDYFHAGNIVIDGLYLKRISPTSATGLLGVGNGANFNSVIKNCLFCGTNSVGGGDIETAITIARDTCPVQVYNCKIWNCANGLLRYTGAGTATQEPLVRYFQNITIYNSLNYGFVCWTSDVGFKIPMDVRNVVMCGSGIADFYEQSPNLYITFLNCSDSDGTLPAHTGVVHNITSANEFESLTSTDNNFLFTKSTGQLANAGNTTLLSDNTAGIEGNPRPNSIGKVSIGCHEIKMAKSYSQAIII